MLEYENQLKDLAKEKINGLFKEFEEKGILGGETEETFDYNKTSTLDGMFVSEGDEEIMKKVEDEKRRIIRRNTLISLVKQNFNSFYNSKKEELVEEFMGGSWGFDKGKAKMRATALCENIFADILADKEYEASIKDIKEKHNVDIYKVAARVFEDDSSMIKMLKKVDEESIQYTELVSTRIKAFGAEIGAQEMAPCNVSMLVTKPPKLEEELFSILKDKTLSEGERAVRVRLLVGYLGAVAYDVVNFKNTNGEILVSSGEAYNFLKQSFSFYVENYSALKRIQVAADERSSGLHRLGRITMIVHASIIEGGEGEMLFGSMARNAKNEDDLDLLLEGFFKVSDSLNTMQKDSLLDSIYKGINKNSNLSADEKQRYLCDSITSIGVDPRRADDCRKINIYLKIKRVITEEQQRATESKIVSFHRRDKKIGKSVAIGIGVGIVFGLIAFGATVLTGGLLGPLLLGVTVGASAIVTGGFAGIISHLTIKEKNEESKAKATNSILKKRSARNSERKEEIKNLKTNSYTNPDVSRASNEIPLQISIGGDNQNSLGGQRSVIV
jgi:hypothetical protein